MLRLFDKGNGVNYIGWDENNTPYEIAKRGGDFYFITMKNRKSALWKKLQQGSFKICDNNEDNN